MKKTRRAAAVWMTMSLALSTIFGSTAWGEVLQETGKNRCTHVHTAECYGDLDETATPSQIGELEPTECTHVCSVESGCILDTEDKKTENISSEDQELSDGRASDNEILDDQEVPSVNTPSNAKDNTSTINGTTMPSSKTKVHSWTWYDPEGILIDGKLELTGVTEEAQPSFEEITEYLPQAIIAQVGNSEAWEEENLQLANWTCAEYVQDENGLWPLEGNYEFTAELPDGYELADGADALVVEVSVAGDQTAMTAGEMIAIITVLTNGKEEASLYQDGTDYLTKKNIGGLKYEKLSDGYHKLTLTNANLNAIHILHENWIIELQGANKAEVDYKYNGIAFFIGDGAEVTITGNGSLDAAGNLIGSGIDVSGKLTIKNGTINASAVPYHGTSSGNDSRIAGIKVAGTLEIVDGSITATGTERYGVYVGGNFQMSGGELTATGEYQQGFVVMDGGSFNLSGGTIKAWEENGSGFAVASNASDTTISGGTLISNRVLLDDATMTIEANGTLQVDRLGLKTSGKLINRGKLIVNGAYDGGGTVVNEAGGTISGTGSVPEEAKQNPGKIGVTNSTLKKEYTNEKIDIQDSAKVTKPNQNVELSYSIDEAKSDGIGTIEDKTGKLTVEKIGTFVIQVTTEKTGIYRQADPVEITLTVTPAKFPEGWNLEITPIRDVVYNGSAGYKAATVTVSGIPSDVKVTYEYQVARTSDIDELRDDQWHQTCPNIANVSESGQHVFVRAVTDNYESKVFVSSNTTEIKQRNFSTDVTVTIEPNTLIYNGKPQMPKIKVVESWNGALGSELIENVDYKIKFWRNEDTGDDVSELKDAGTYTVYLLGTGNYDMSTNSAAFTIQKSTLFLLINGNVNKVYDGTVGVTDAQKLAIQLATTKEGTNPFDKIYVDHVEWEYNYADAGKRILTAHDVKIAGPNVENYQLESTSVSYYGTIAKRDFEPMTVTATPLTYNGTEQQPQIDASVNTGLDTVSGSNAKISYSVDGVEFQSEVPSFKVPGTYTVHVKAEMDNFNPITDTVEVIVQKAAAPTAAGLSETYSYKETGEKRVKFTGIPEDCGTLGAVTAQIVSDEGKILDGSAAVDGSELVFKLKGSSKDMIGKTAQIVVTVETQNYEDIKIPVTVTLKADPSDSDDNSGNGGSGNNNSGNNSGNSGSGNGNSGSGGSNGSNSGNSGSSGSSSDDSDYTDSKTTAPKLSDVRSGNAANNAANNVTKDNRKGYQSSSHGVITGTDNQVTNDGYSHWMKDSKGWWLRYCDGSYPMGSAGEYNWEKINGRWWAFGPDGYLSTGWIYDTVYQGWFYMDANHGMLTGWQFIDGKWYYLNPVSDGTCGIMYAKKRTPDGWLVKEDGSWDEEAGK